jgi:hypothetical protein
MRINRTFGTGRGFRLFRGVFDGKTMMKRAFWTCKKPGLAAAKTR